MILLNKNNIIEFVIFPLLLLNIMCGNEYHEMLNHKKTPVLLPFNNNYPRPGNDGEVFSNGLVLNWTKAASTEEETNEYKYRVFYSLSDNINSIDAMTRNGLPACDWMEGIETLDVTYLNLGINQVYYFNVMVMDAKGNQSAYKGCSIDVVPCYYDHEPPVIVHPKNGYLLFPPISTKKITLTIKDANGVTVTNSVQISNNTWYFYITLKGIPNGFYSKIITATDECGNKRDLIVKYQKSSGCNGPGLIPTCSAALKYQFIE